MGTYPRSNIEQSFVQCVSKTKMHRTWGIFCTIQVQKLAISNLGTTLNACTASVFRRGSALAN